MGDTAASGAYWIASVCDVIVANPTTLTGSIGVRMDVTDLQGLYDKLGIETHTFKSGTMKDMGASDREITPEEQTVFQGIIDDMYGQFVDVVAEGRKMDRNAVLALADGRVFTGRQAKDLGLVDQLGNYYDAIRLAGERAGIGENPETTTFYEAGFWESIFSSKNTKLPALQPPILEDKDPSVWLKME